MSTVTEVPPHVQRMIEELEQLGERLGKLKSFFDSPVFKGLDPIDQSLLDQQYQAMSDYFNILTRRVARTQEK